MRGGREAVAHDGPDLLGSAIDPLGILEILQVPPGKLLVGGPPGHRDPPLLLYLVLEARGVMIAPLSSIRASFVSPYSVMAFSVLLLIPGRRRLEILKIILAHRDNLVRIYLFLFEIHGGTMR